MSRVFLSHSSVPSAHRCKGMRVRCLASRSYPDGHRIVSSSRTNTFSRDNTLRLWPAPDAWPDELCAKLTRNMSRKQWREWVSPDIDYVKQCPGLPIPPDASDNAKEKP